MAPYTALHRINDVITTLGFKKNIINEVITNPDYVLHYKMKNDVRIYPESALGFYFCGINDRRTDEIKYEFSVYAYCVEVITEAVCFVIETQVGRREFTFVNNENTGRLESDDVSVEDFSQLSALFRPPGASFSLDNVMRYMPPVDAIIQALNYLANNSYFHSRFPGDQPNSIY